MPNIPALEEEVVPKKYLKDPAFIKELEEAVVNWETYIDNTIASCVGKVWF